MIELSLEQAAAFNLGRSGPDEERFPLTEAAASRLLGVHAQLTASAGRLRTEAVRMSLGSEDRFSSRPFITRFTASLVWGTTERDFADDPVLLQAIHSAAALVPRSPMEATLYLYTDPDATAIVDGVPIEIEEGWYAGAVIRGANPSVTAEGAQGAARKTVHRFWPVGSP